MDDGCFEKGVFCRPVASSGITYFDFVFTAFAGARLTTGCVSQKTLRQQFLRIMVFVFLRHRLFFG
ncbi:hypothetical protein TH25_07980 [Thalassospira profundimaris]|uniref:Uncharacterized protein n=1 Tax=Thalassospira profundimaris TaxID=502049 RepID=A0A367XDA2_9PROT|nr:hypothetical protein TH25_07980 [Thalassospira profundimaris]